MKILADKSIPFAQNLFPALGELDMVESRDIDRASVRDMDLLIVRTVTQVDRTLLDGSSVRFVASASSGRDHVDTIYLGEQGIDFIHAPGCNAESVCEYVLSSLFSLEDQYGFTLPGKRFGIIGHGNIGSRLHRILQSMGMEVASYDPLIKDNHGKFPFSDLDTVLDADIISLHVPLTTDGDYPTRDMVNRDFLSLLKDDVVLINTSRGAVVNESALTDFLAANTGARAIIDVWQHEPDINMLLVQQAAVATPHIAGYSLDAKTRASYFIYRELAERLRVDSVKTLPDLPRAELHAIRLADNDDRDNLRLAVLSCYDVRSDSAALRRITELDVDKRGAYFESLRVNYPLRREFHAMQVQLASNSRVLHEMLLALGFDVETGQDGLPV